MYINKGSGLLQYETLDEILDAKIDSATMDENKYYFIVHYDDIYSNTVWVVDKKTEAVSQMTLIEYMFDNPGIDNVESFDPQSIKRVS